jgi:hypothetical protein
MLSDKQWYPSRDHRSPERPIGRSSCSADAVGQATEGLQPTAVFHSETDLGNHRKTPRRIGRGLCRKKGVQIDERLKLFGVSGTGAHRDPRTPFGQFLGKIEEGEVPVGSWLLVEMLDRLSRENPLKAGGELYT